MIAEADKKMSDDQVDGMQEKPMSVLHELADHYFHDSLDFGVRFDQLWEAGPLMHKMGRTKSFIDLLMGCECALKAHGILSHLKDDPRAVYNTIRTRGHRIDQLADYALLLDDRNDYDVLSEGLGEFSVQLRYSLDAYGAFFPWYRDGEVADLDYSATIGNHRWVLGLRACHVRLNDKLARILGGLVTDDLGAIFAHDREMQEFADSFAKRRGHDRQPG